MELGYFLAFPEKHCWLPCTYHVQKQFSTFIHPRHSGWVAFILNILWARIEGWQTKARSHCRRIWNSSFCSADLIERPCYRDSLGRTPFSKKKQMIWNFRTLVATCHKLPVTHLSVDEPWWQCRQSSADITQAVNQHLWLARCHWPFAACPTIVDGVTVGQDAAAKSRRCASYW